jgi:hypothetical protein
VAGKAPKMRRSVDTRRKGTHMIALFRRLLGSKPIDLCEVHYRMAEEMVESGAWREAEQAAKSPCGVVLRRVVAGPLNAMEAKVSTAIVRKILQGDLAR